MSSRPSSSLLMLVPVFQLGQCILCAVGLCRVALTIRAKAAMNASSEYFRSGYQEDIAEIRRALEPIEQALRVFEDHFDAAIGGWPYRRDTNAVEPTPNRGVKMVFEHPKSLFDG